MEPEPQSESNHSTVPLLIALGPLGGMVIGANNLISKNLEAREIALPPFSRPLERWALLERSIQDVAVQCGQHEGQTALDSACEFYSFFSPHFEWAVHGAMWTLASVQSWWVPFVALLLSSSAVAAIIRWFKR